MENHSVIELGKNPLELSYLAKILSPNQPFVLWEVEEGAYLAHNPERQFISTALAPNRGIFEELQCYLDELPKTKISEQDSPGTFEQGLAGFLAYDAGRYLENIEGAEGHSEDPDVFFISAENLVTFDPVRNQLLNHSTMYPINEGLLEEALQHSLRLSTLSFSKEQATIASATKRTLNSQFSKSEFEDIVTQAQEYIRAGDVFQVVLGNEHTIDQTVDPYLFYAILKKLNPSPCHFLVSFPEGFLVGASPEVMLKSRKGSGQPKENTSVYMRPVAGTYPRPPSSQMPAGFTRDVKERAEHVMLVDHARNDIGRVSKIGSVEVEELLSVERYRDVFHLVSQVKGTLRDKATALDALLAAFPIATLVGTPKIRAMEIIVELESQARGVFGGAVGLLGPDNFIDTGVIIRSAVVGKEKTRIRAGAGIVHDSDPSREFEECSWKAKAVLDAVELAFQLGAKLAD